MTTNLLVIGKGHWGQKYISTLSSFQNVSLTIANRSNWKDLIDNKPNGVIVCTPPQTHIEIAKYALEQNIPVMIEKPLALSLKDAEQLKLYTAPILVNHIHLFSNKYQSIKQQLQTNPQDIYITDMGSRPNQKHNINDLWDYGSHSISMAIDLANQYPKTIICRKFKDKLERLFDITLCFDFFTARIVVGFNEERIIRLLIDDNSNIEYNGTTLNENDRPLTNALRVFIDALNGKQDYRLGLDLPLKVLQILEECEAKIIK